MKLRPYVILALARKDLARLIRNGPALMLLGLFVIVAILLASSGLVEETPQPQVPQQEQTNSKETREAAWIVYEQDDDKGWINLLKRRAPKELGIRFVEREQITEEDIPPDLCVIQIRKPMYFKDRDAMRRLIQYRHPGSDPNVLWPVSRWFLSVSLEHFGKMPQFFETIESVQLPAQEGGSRAALENVSLADMLKISLIGTVLLTSIQFFAACGLLVSLAAQEREKGSLRALLLTPATYFEFVASKALVHGGLAIGTSVLVVLAINLSVLASLLFWTTIFLATMGYFALGLLITSFAKNQTAPNLLSFTYLLAIGTLNLLSMRFEVFQLLSALTFERYGLVFTYLSLNSGGVGLEASLAVMRLPGFLIMATLCLGLFLLATAIGARRLRV